MDDLVLLHGGPTDEEVLGLDVPVDEVKNLWVIFHLKRSSLSL